TPQVYRLGLRILNDPQDAEDILQETFIKAFRSIKEFEGRSSISTWLYRIAVNEALMLARKRRPEAFSLDDTQTDGGDGQPEPMQVVDWCCLPEAELLSAEGRKFLENAIDRLPETLRVVFVLRDLQDLSIKETAEALDLSETAVKTRLLRARLNLRDQLSSYYGERMMETKRP
ncbi:MAG TPA: sigma-70 family RNA polymerase sigma factor, partial [Anaerolineaceae bacterium]